MRIQTLVLVSYPEHKLGFRSTVQRSTVDDTGNIVYGKDPSAWGTPDTVNNLEPMFKTPIEAIAQGWTFISVIECRQNVFWFFTREVIETPYRS